MIKNIHGRRLLVRADGGTAIGFGHVMRSMAIAEEWIARGGHCLWATTSPEALNAAGSNRDVERIVISAAAGSAEDAKTTRRLAEENEASWVMADLFSFSPGYLASAGARRVKWMVVHDEPLQVCERIDAILNPGPQAAPELYPGRSAKCELLLGLDYALLRSELRTRPAGNRSRTSSPRKVLITFGGSDPLDATWKTLVELAVRIPACDVRWRIILGPGYRGRCPGDGQAFGDLQVEFVRYTSDMGAHYAWADLIVCGASTTLWEALSFGVPAVAIPIAANQSKVFEALARDPAVKGFASPGPALADWMLGAIGGEEKDWLVLAGESGPRVVDGQGVTRVVNFLAA